MSPSGEAIDGRNSEKAPLPEMTKVLEKSGDNLILENRLALEPPDLIPKISALNRKSSSVQDVREGCKKYEYSGRTSYERYRLLPSQNNRLSSESVRIATIQSRSPDHPRSPDNRTISEDGLDSDHIRKTAQALENLRNKSESDKLSEPLEERRVVSKEALYQSKELEVVKPEPSIKCEETTRGGCLAETPEVAVVAKTEELTRYGVSVSVRGVDTLETSKPWVNGEKEKPGGLQRAQSAQEKQVSRSDSVKSVEGKVDRSASLRLVERSTSFGRTDTMRVVLRPERISTGESNLSTSDASSQTDLLDDEMDETAQRRREEDLEYERLSRDLASHLPPSDKLQGLLVPESERKKPADYVAGLFLLDLSTSNRQRRQSRRHKDSSGSSSLDSSPSHTLVNGTSAKSDKAESLPSNSPYFTTSESKAKMLTRYPDSIDSLALRDSKELHKKKEELMTRLDKKLQVLRAEQVSLSEELTANEELGASVVARIALLGRPHEAAKYRLHVEEVGKITSLLLGLSGRLARAENALLGLPLHHDERKLHESKRDKLEEQLAEAKLLKESIDRRSESVSKTLVKYLTNEEFADYLHFIQMKAKLIVDGKEIADKVLLGEEQLAALRETLTS